MRRKIIEIDEEKCTGCGECVDSCIEGAIQIVNGKAKLVKDSYCDGLGACLKDCPEGALTIEERDVEPFDEKATKKHVESAAHARPKPCACPGTMTRQIERRPGAAAAEGVASELTQWPVQLTLVSPEAPYFQDANLLLVADCVPFAMGDFHARFLRGRAVAVGCPKLDDPGFYVEKLAEILKHSAIKSLTVVHMEVPCCFGLRRIADQALAASGKDIPLRDVTIGIDGEVRSEE